MATVRPLLPRTLKRRGRSDAKLQWFGEQVQKDLKIGLGTRIKIVAQMIRDRVVINISEPVRKLPGQKTRIAGQKTRTRVDPASRSKPGEFPRADTTRLQKDIFWDMDEKKLRAVVGTTLDYGLILETRMKRSFLRRTLGEVEARVKSIIGRNRPSDFPNNNK